jgi:hypothetical protein
MRKKNFRETFYDMKKGKKFFILSSHDVNELLLVEKEKRSRFISRW